ncbi:MAG: glycosyltransferase family 2 protein [Candidatus Curtissbacteria bacterium]|nr:glycosyltransferase family 2 protein [Candidatus Curtissbacteria bacterium]
MDQLKIAIVVLNYKGLGETLECLESLRRCAKGNYNVEIIVVENGSDDGSVEALSKIKDTHFVANNKNLGFSGGMNSGIRYALKRNADYIIILNNDTIVDKNLVVTLAKSAQSADIVAPKIYFAPGFEFHKDRYKKQDLGKVIWYAGGSIDWKNILGIHTGVDEIDKGQFAKYKEIDFATGACMLIKKEVFEKIGLLDEKYFLYLEDMDFCVRVKKAGFKIKFCPGAILWHKNAVSAGGSGSKLQDYYITRNRLLFAFKYAKPRTKIAVLKQIILQSGDPLKRKALIDFLTFKFGAKQFT